MSGICGIIHFDGVPTRQETLRALIEAAEHRGPDGISTWRDGSVGLAHLALNVTPESEREDQPLVNREAGHVLVADARVDNRDALISALRGTLRTDVPTDADLILAAYRKWGLDCAEHLIGDFAFAIWDGRERRLFAARDAMAMRPFYYRIEEDRLLFGSEVKQILAAPEVPMEIFEPMVAAYLQGRFDPLDWTFYEGIKQLEPSHALLVEADGSHRTWRYWDIDPDNRIRYDNEQDYVEHFRELFAEAVRCRLRSTKPIGLLLSGGLDSGSIASMAGYLQEKEGIGCPELRTHSWKFPTLTQCDERHVSDHIAERYNFSATYINAEKNAPLSNYPNHGPDLDTPYHGVYQELLENSYATAQSEGISLVMSGDRGDLMVGEYIYDYPSLFWLGEWNQLISELRTQSNWKETNLWVEIMRHLIRPAWPPGRFEPLRKPLRSIYRTIRGTSKKAETENEIHPSWIQEKFAKTGEEENSEQASTFDWWTPARRRRYEAIFAPMHMRAATWSNRTQAKFNLDFADPWSDRRVAEFVAAIPQRALNRTGDEKYLIRRAMKNIMPERARSEAAKVSPGPLYTKSLNEDAVETIMQLVTNTCAENRGFIDEERLLEGYESIRDSGDRSYFWPTLAVEMWLRQYWS